MTLGTPSNFGAARGVAIAAHARGLEGGAAGPCAHNGDNHEETLGAIMHDHVTSSLGLPGNTKSNYPKCRKCLNSYFFEGNISKGSFGSQNPQSKLLLSSFSALGYPKTPATFFFFSHSGTFQRERRMKSISPWCFLVVLWICIQAGYATEQEERYIQVIHISIV